MLIDTIKNIQHGGVKSFLLYAYNNGANIEHLKNSVYKITYNNKVLYLGKKSLPIPKSLGRVSADKFATKIILADLDISVPKGIVVSQNDLSLLGAPDLRFPLITKPLDGSLARGVQWNIATKEELLVAVSRSLESSPSKKVLVEEQFIGREFRILVFNNTFVSCVEKIPAQVIGDGKSSISELIDIYNQSRQEGFTILIDIEIEKKLDEQGYTLAFIPEDGIVVPLRNRLNASLGGRLIERSSEIHVSYKTIAERAISALGLTFGGIDILIKDIHLSDSPYVVLEVNPMPFYNMHEKPLVEGPAVNVSQLIFDTHFCTSSD